METPHTTGNSRMDFLLVIQSFLMVGFSMTNMEALIKLVLMSTGILLNMVGVLKFYSDYRKAKKDANKR